MRKTLKTLCALSTFVAVSIVGTSRAYSVEYPYRYVFFENSLMKDNHFYTAVTYSGQSWVKNMRSRLPLSEEKSFTPGNSLELTYRSAANGEWAVDVQYANVRGNTNFIKSDVLSFWIYLSDNVSTDILPEVGIKKRDGATPFVAVSKYMTAPVAGKWNHVVIPLKDFGLGQTDNTVSRTISAVTFRQGRADDKEHQIFLDQIELLPANLQSATLKAPTLASAKGYERHIDIEWNDPVSEKVKYYKVYRSFDNKNFEALDIRPNFFHRFTDFVGQVGRKAYYKISAVDWTEKESPLSNVVTAETKPMNDGQFLDMIQEAHFKYYWDGAEPNSGLARENIPGRHDMIASGASGFGIMAVIAAAERGFITREQAVERFLKITSFLERTEKFHGAFSHFIDGNSAKVEPFFGENDNGGDLVETSFLMQGLLTVHQYFNKDNEKENRIRQSIDKLWKGVEWSWYRQKADDPFLTWHWSPDKEWRLNHQLIGWNETMITYLLAIMSPTHGVPPEMYYTGWASPSEKAQAYRSAWGRTEEGKDYTNGNTYYGITPKVGVSSGGPLFFVHYSYFGFNPKMFTDRYVNYFDNNRDLTLINYRYCLENPGKYAGYGAGCWGLSASDYVRYQAAEPVLRKDNGTIPPNAAVASMPYTPSESMAALKNYYQNYGSFLWGEYGFRDAFNISENWCSPIYMGLNQAPMTIMIENYRTGLLWNLFMSHPDVKSGLDKLNKIK